MSIFTFVTQDELDNLDEDPRMAFLGLVNHAQRNLSKQLAGLNTEDEREWKTAQNGSSNATCSSLKSDSLLAVGTGDGEL